MDDGTPRLQVGGKPASISHYSNSWGLSTPDRPGSGFKLAFSKPPQNLTINLGANLTTSPAPVSARFGESGEWVTLNLTAGANVLDVTSLGLVDAAHPGHPIVFNVVTQSETSGRIQLESVEVDAVSDMRVAETRLLTHGSHSRKQRSLHMSRRNSCLSLSATL